ncbi:2123_t:CDS:2 [Diversispora eburnea]|uniref:2123_t:CDS:1 n=1 Tax=Diversispora eburnea TaxID=1213867 RepID=A0A9N9FYP3_9GLOM|nr:2123_t:CDS:2 [Diversispora eburnea]
MLYENQEKAIKSQRHESFLSSSISHLQSCYISRSIHTLHGLYNSLEDIKFGKSQDNDILRQFIIADENQFEFQRQKLFLSSSTSHPQSCYISRNIHTLHGLQSTLEDIKSGKSQDPNLLKSNESTVSSVSTYDIDSKESLECINWEKEIQIMQKNDHSQL